VSSLLRYPAFVAEMGLPANRPKLWAGVWSGYAIAAAFAVLAFGAVVFDLSPYGREFAMLVAIKLITNTTVLIALRRGGRGALELMGINMTADTVLMTAAMYYTGGPSSPLFAVYVIEVTVTALLSNVGVTVLTAAGIVVCFTSMCALIGAGVLVRTTPPGLTGTLGPTQIAVYVAFAIFTLGTPTLFTLRILARLRSKEAALQARTAELIEAGKQRSVFLASVTHELRTPIHGIQGLADLIVSGVYGPASDRQRDAAISIKRSSHSLLHLIDDLLALVRADVGRLEPKPAPLDLRDLIDQVIASVQWMLGPKKLTITPDVPAPSPDVPAPSDHRIVTDRRLVGHILVNLVANAAKFTPEGGKVEVRGRVSGRTLELAVADTGIGIPNDKREAIFEAFRQLDMSDERTYGGVGLGLALVKRLCSLLGGTVEVESTVGKGSTFTVRLPCRLPTDTSADGPGTSGIARAAAG